MMSSMVDVEDNRRTTRTPGYTFLISPINKDGECLYTALETILGVTDMRQRHADKMETMDVLATDIEDVQRQTNMLIEDLFEGEYRREDPVWRALAYMLGSIGNSNSRQPDQQTIDMCAGLEYNEIRIKDESKMLLKYYKATIPRTIKVTQVAIMKIGEAPNRNARRNEGPIRVRNTWLEIINTGEERGWPNIAHMAWMITCAFLRKSGYGGMSLLHLLVETYENTAFMIIPIVKVRTPTTLGALDSLGAFVREKTEEEMEDDFIKSVQMITKRTAIIKRVIFLMRYSGGGVEPHYDLMWGSQDHAVRTIPEELQGVIREDMENKFKTEMLRQYRVPT